MNIFLSKRSQRGRTRLEFRLVKTKAPIATGHAADRTTQPLIEAYLQAQHLKQLFRQGWLRLGVSEEHCESVAEHSFGVALLALWLVDQHYPDLDRDKVLRLALVHDLGEVHAGDITPVDGVPADEKHRRERASVDEVFASLPNGEEYLALWMEFEDQETPESQLVKQIDRLEMAFQAAVYEHQDLADLKEFFDSADAAIRDPALREILEELVRLRR